MDIRPTDGFSRSSAAMACFAGYGYINSCENNKLEKNIKDFTMDKERKTIYLCLAHMSEDGMEQKYVK